MAGAAGSPGALRCVFCCYAGEAQGIADTAWITKATAISRDYSPAAAQSYLEGHSLCLHSQAPSSELQKKAYFDSQLAGAGSRQSGQAAPTPGQEAKPSVRHLAAADEQRETRNKKRRWGDEQSPRCFWHTAPPGRLVALPRTSGCVARGPSPSCAPQQHLAQLPQPVSNARKSPRLLQRVLY